MEDIAKIRRSVDLPVIGIIKKVYNDRPDVYITPTMAEADALAGIGGGVILDGLLYYGAGSSTRRRWIRRTSSPGLMNASSLRPPCCPQPGRWTRR